MLGLSIRLGVLNPSTYTLNMLAFVRELELVSQLRPGDYPLFIQVATPPHMPCAPKPALVDRVTQVMAEHTPSSPAQVPPIPLSAQ